MRVNPVSGARVCNAVIFCDEELSDFVRKLTDSVTRKGAEEFASVCTRPPHSVAWGRGVKINQTSN
jgi:hypothetical protein